MKKTFTKVTLGCLMLLTITLWQACKKDEVTTPQVDPKVTSYFPNSGNAGTLVTIEGEGLGTSIGDYEATVAGVRAEVISATATAVVIRMPQAGASGAISVRYADKTFDVGTYTYQDLTISSIFPTNGPAGSQIRIEGAGFGSANVPAKVTINGREALVVSISDRVMVVEIPAKAGTGPVVIAVDGKKTQGQSYKYQEIESIKPLTGGKNTRVAIKGEGFETLIAGNIVDFNGKAATVVEATEEQLIVVAPDGVATGPLSVTINNQKITGPTFSVAPFPTIRTVTPLSAPAGSEVIITGENYSTFSDEVTVTINGVEAPIVKTDASTITLKVPESAGHGLVQVSVNDQLTQGPEFKEQNLGITGIFPDNGMAGDEITITGIGFGTQSSDNKVLFNQVAATVVSATATELKVIVPANVSTGQLTVESNGINAQWPEFKRAGVMTLAGSPTSSDFTSLQSIAVDSKGNVYVTTAYHMIKKITPAGVVTVFAGGTQSGMVDHSVGGSARFNSISGLAVGENDNLYVADRFNSRIRRVTPDGAVTTVATLPFSPISVTADPQHNIFVGREYSGPQLLNKMLGSVTRVSTGANETPDYMAAFSSTEMYYAPAYTDYLRIYQILNTAKTTFAGSGSYGLSDGTSAANAAFQPITGIALNSSTKVLYVVHANTVLRKVEDGIVTTLAGLNTNGQTKPGYQDGSFVNAQFQGITGICIDKEGNVYIADNGNKAVRKVIFK